MSVIKRKTKRRRKKMAKKEFFNGIKDSLPVGVGYFAVSFGFGISAVGIGIKLLEATLISLTNLTSAGQFAALAVIATAAPFINMVITQAVINSRYFLMGLALSQRLGNDFGIGSRLIISFYNTDEIFAIAMSRGTRLTKPYMFGLGPLPIIGWSLGTFLGAFAGTVLPANVTAALGVALYGMFVAIVVPQVKSDKTMAIAALLAASLSCVFTFVPVLSSLSGGVSVVIVTVVVAAICAVLFPEED